MINKLHFLTGASRDSFFLIIVKLVTASLGFVLTRLLADSLSIAQFGTYSQAMLLVSTLVSLTILGMIDGTNYFFHHACSLESKERYMSTIVFMQCLIGVVSGLMLLVFHEFIIRYFDNSALKSLLLFTSALPLLQNLISILQIMFVAIGKARQIAVRNLLISISKLVLYFVACQVLKSLPAILLFTILLDLAQILYFTTVLNHNNCTVSVHKIDFSLMKPILRYCIPMAAFIMINALSRDCDKYVISALTNTENLAVYANASKPLPFDIITGAYITVLVPYLTRYIAEQQFEKARSLYRLLLEVSLLTTGIMAFASIVSAPMLMELLYTQKYLSGINVFIVYTLVDIIRFLSMTLILAAAGKTKILVYLATGSIAANFLLNLLLFRLMGTLGPAIATLLILTLTGLIIQNCSASVLQCRLCDLFDWKRLLLFLAEALLLIPVFLILSRALGELHYITRLLIVGGGYGLALLALNLKRLFLCVRQIGEFR